MVRRVIACCALAAGCGRIGFDPPSVFGSRGGPGSQVGETIAVARDGSLGVGGELAGSLDLGEHLTSHGGYDAFIGHLTDDGRPLWLLAFGDTGDDYVHGVAFDDAGNLYVVGAFVGTIDVGGGPLQALGEEDIFVASFTPDGEHRWSRRFGDRTTSSPYGSDEGLAVAIGGGTVYVGGQFDGTVDFGTGPLTASATGYDAFVAAFATDGTPRWARHYGGNSYNLVSGLTATADGAYASGYFEGTADFGGGPLTSRGNQDMFVVGLGADGTYRWSTGAGGTGTDWARSIAADDAGNVYVAGSFQATVDFASGPVTAATPAAAFVVSYSSGGAPRWQRTYVPDCAKALGVATDAMARVYVGGYFDTALDAGAGQFASKGPGDAFAAAFDRDGTLQHASRIGGEGFDMVRGIAASASGRVYATGATGTNEMCPFYARVVGDEDLFISEIHP